ncbi:S24 family peptidase [Acidovorax sp. LjRoot74]|uniref:S24 family peptidase n=1 Tax=Acidovorax sp. LjRoot74 TaxID=3342337 RepID=UPI003ED0D154
MFLLSTSFDVRRLIECTMAKTRAPDPLNDFRRSALQKFCESKDWKHPNGRWKNAEIAKFFGRPSQQITNLLTGVGSFGGHIARELEGASHGELSMGELDGLTDDTAFEDVPRIDVRLAGGDGAIAGYEEVIGSLKFAGGFLRDMRVSPSKARIVSVRGHSMHPTVPDGSVLLINTAEAAKEPVHGQIFALARPHEGLSVKRLKQEDGYWFATSDNPAGPRFRIDDGEPVKIIGRALWMGTVL